MPPSCTLNWPTYTEPPPIHRRGRLPFFFSLFHLEKETTKSFANSLQSHLVRHILHYARTHTQWTAKNGLPSNQPPLQQQQHGQTPKWVNCLLKRGPKWTSRTDDWTIMKIDNHPTELRFDLHVESKRVNERTSGRFAVASCVKCNFRWICHRPTGRASGEEHKAQQPGPAHSQHREKIEFINK